MTTSPAPVEDIDLGHAVILWEGHQSTAEIARTLGVPEWRIWNALDDIKRRAEEAE